MPRLYLYSPKDDIVSSDDVEQHIALARQHGIDVTAEKFLTSKHVAHARSEPERYWNSIAQLWNKSGSAAKNTEASHK